MKVSEILTDESKWCKRSTAVDQYGALVDHRSEKACRWCVLGALYRADTKWHEQDRFVGIFCDLVGAKDGIPRWQDDNSRTFAEVREAVLMTEELLYAEAGESKTH